MSTQETVRLDSKKSHIVYKTTDGRKVPGASTVAKIGDSGEALIHWAWKLGCQGLDYKKVRESAADSGTIAHFLVMCHLRGQKADLADYAKPEIDKAETAFLWFLEFWDKENLEAIETELPLVSDFYAYGGTMDILARCKTTRDLVLLDWKSSNAIYPAHLSQLAGYENLAKEAGHLVIRRAIVRIPKEDSKEYEVRWLSNIDRWWEVFKAQLQLYYALKNAK